MAKGKAEMALITVENQIATKDRNKLPPEVDYLVTAGINVRV